MLERHVAHHDAPPRQTSADGGYASTANLQQAKRSWPSLLSSVLRNAGKLIIAHPTASRMTRDERPLLIVQLRANLTVKGDDILSFLDAKIAKWWMPDAVAIVEAIPHTATWKDQEDRPSRAIHELRITQNLIPVRENLSTHKRQSCIATFVSRIDLDSAVSGCR